MTDPPRRANSGLPRDDGALSLISMKAALHQGFCLPLPNELDRPTHLG